MFSPSDAEGPDRVMIRPTLTTVSAAIAGAAIRVPSPATPKASFWSIFIWTGPACEERPCQNYPAYHVDLRSTDVGSGKSEMIGGARRARGERAEFDVGRGKFNATEFGLILKGHGRVNAELGPDSLLAHAHIFVPARARNENQIGRRLHARRDGIFDVDGVANIDVVIDNRN